MGACISSGGVSEEDKVKHREAEKALKEAKVRMEHQVKVLLLGSGDSGKSTILKQMRLIHDVNFSAQEVEFYRQLVFANITQGMKQLLDALEDMDIKLGEASLDLARFVDDAPDIKDGQPFPREYYEPLKLLWEDENVQRGWARGNEAALPDNLAYFYSDLKRFFEPSYQPTEQDIIRCKARTIGITETVFKLKAHEMLMVDVGGQKSERRKWIHCFQDVTTILFLVSLSGYDQCLVEDKDANQMQDAMTIWDSICHSQWFRSTSIILFLNKNDIFEEKIAHSDIRNHFPDYEGEPGNVQDGREYFRQRFTKLSRKSGQAREREIYVHFTNATDTKLLRVVMAAVEVSCFTPIYPIIFYQAMLNTPVAADMSANVQYRPA